MPEGGMFGLSKRQEENLVKGLGRFHSQPYYSLKVLTPLTACAGVAILLVLLLWFCIVQRRKHPKPKKENHWYRCVTFCSYCGHIINADDKVQEVYTEWDSDSDSNRRRRTGTRLVARKRKPEGLPWWRSSWKICGNCLRIQNAAEAERRGREVM